MEKVKEKVEDGIFGTSGGIGFTKQNELFVGRVAMLGFAVSTSLRSLLQNSTCLRFDKDKQTEFLCGSDEECLR